MKESYLQLRIQKGQGGKWCIDDLIGYLNAIKNTGITSVDIKLEEFKFKEDIKHTRLLITN